MIDLVPIRLFPPEEEMGFGEVYDYIIAPHGQRREAGRIRVPACIISDILGIMLIRHGAVIIMRPGPVRFWSR